MTDEFETTTNGPSVEEDLTSRVPTPPAPSTPISTPIVPTAPLTPVSRASLPPQSFEHEVAWSSADAAEAIPVVTATRPRRGGRARWAISIAVIALVITTSVGVALLITGRSSTSAVLGYVPDDAIMYGEVRLDLPGDQRSAVGEFLSKFPGFADQAALDPKLDEILDQLVKDATNGDQTFTTNIKPWFDGELGFSMGPLPSATSLLNDPSSIGSFRALALVSIKDPVAAQAWFTAAIAKTGATPTTEAYDGTTLTVFATGTGPKAAFALVDGKVAVAGDIVSVKAAVDTKGASRFSSQPGPKAAIDSATGDYIGFVYVGLRPLMDWTNQMSSAGSQGTGLQNTALSAAMLKVVPDWGASWLRIERDAVVLQVVAPKPETPIGPTENRTSAVVAHIPGTAVVTFTSDDFGKTVKQYLDLYRSEPAYKSVLDQVDQALGLVGGEDAAIGWAGDTAAVVNISDGTPEGGLIVAPTDKAAADHLFTSLRSFIALAGAQQGVSVRDEIYNGTTLTIVDLGDIHDRSGMAGGIASGGLTLPTGHIELAYAVTGDIVVIGSGPAFVKHVLDTTTATSLASNGRYKSLADRAGSGTGTTFVDITAIRGLLEKAATGAVDATGPALLAKYEKDVKPFLVPFDAAVMSGSVNGDMTRSVIYITVK
jgi:Protein of unknown function (DUF3352).